MDIFNYLCYKLKEPGIVNTITLYSHNTINNDLKESSKLSINEIIVLASPKYNLSRYKTSLIKKLNPSAQISKVSLVLLAVLHKTLSNL